MLDAGGCELCELAEQTGQYSAQVHIIALDLSDLIL